MKKPYATPRIRSGDAKGKGARIQFVFLYETYTAYCGSGHKLFVKHLGAGNLGAGELAKNLNTGVCVNMMKKPANKQAIPAEA